MKTILALLAAALIGNARAEEPPSKEQWLKDWAEAELSNLKVAKRQYASALADPKFYEAVKVEKDAAIAAHDPMFDSPDWAFKLLGRTWEKVYGSASTPPASSPAALDIITPDDVKKAWGNNDPSIRDAIMSGEYDLSAQAFACQYNWQQCVNAGAVEQAKHWETEMAYVRIQLKNAARYKAAQQMRRIEAAQPATEGSPEAPGPNPAYAPPEDPSDRAARIAREDAEDDAKRREASERLRQDVDQQRLINGISDAVQRAIKERNFSGRITIRP